jgi:hypothetical protein
MARGERVEISMRICIFLIIDGLKLEAQACLLLPSLRRHLGDSVSVIAYRRKDASAPLQPVTEQVLQACKVTLREIPGTGPDQPSPWREPYPIGNKILAASDPRDCDISVFIDTDMIFSGPIDFAKLLGAAEIAAVVSDYSTLSNDEAGWQAFYGHFGLPLPTERVTLLKGRALTSLPYFNAGMIVFREKLGAKNLCFGAEWLADTRRFDHEITYPYTRGNLDQLSLPITAARLGYPVKPVSNKYNHNLQGHGDPPEANPCLLHYHTFGVLWSHEARGRAALDDLQNVLPSQSLDDFYDSFMAILKRKRLKKLL